MGERESTPTEVLTRHLAALTLDLEEVLKRGARGRYGPETIMEAIASTVEHIATLETTPDEGPDHD